MFTIVLYYCMYTYSVWMQFVLCFSRETREAFEPIVKMKLFFFCIPIVINILWVSRYRGAFNDEVFLLKNYLVDTKVQQSMNTKRWVGVEWKGMPLSAWISYSKYKPSVNVKWDCCCFADAVFKITLLKIISNRLFFNWVGMKMHKSFDFPGYILFMTYIGRRKYHTCFSFRIQNGKHKRNS